VLGKAVEVGACETEANRSISMWSEFGQICDRFSLVEFTFKF
jgi:hypothetical protein